jgi:hypothetical protein
MPWMIFSGLSEVKFCGNSGTKESLKGILSRHESPADNICKGWITAS